MQTKYLDVKLIDSKIKNYPQKLINECENKFKAQLEKIADKILEKETPVKIILIGGPSCSGKTTSARLLGNTLKKHGKKVLSIEMDNFFISKDQRPRLANGSIDFDSINIVNLELMQKCFSELFETGKSKFPIYDFIAGKSIPNSTLVKADSETVIIFEGIHTLNPKLIEKLGTKDIYKIFINNADGYEYDDTKINPRQFRMVRRMVRDVQFRAVSIANTLKHWGDVTEAEDLYILPFSTKVDSTINTSHAYEINLFKSDIENAVLNNEITLEQIPWFHIFGRVENLNKKLLPKTSLMQEFINFEKWKNTVFCDI